MPKTTTPPPPGDDDPDQLALFDHAGEPTEPTRPTLDALIQRARTEAATKAEGGAVGTLLHRLAQGDGSAPVEVLRSEGFPAEVIAAAVLPDPADGRVRPRARLGIVGDSPLLWLSTSGWQASGFSSRRERHPSAESAEHAAAPAHLAGWLRRQLAPWTSLRVDVATGAPTRAFSERVKSLAWATIQGRGDATGDAGALLSGVLPDALLVESFGGDAAWYASAWGHDPAEHADTVEQTCLLEVQRVAPNPEPLRWKVERHRSLLDLGAAHAVVWVVRTAEVADRLADLGVGEPATRQLLVSARSVGLSGEELDLPHTWWPLRLNTQEAQKSQR